MIRIGQKITKSIVRYEKKNTVSARYERHRTRADLFALATGIEVFRLPSWEPAIDIPITSMLATFSLKNFKDSFKLWKELRTIKKRALSIKKAARNNK